MAKVKVRHALVTYTDAKGNLETVFRGQIVNIPEGPQLERLRNLDAVVDETDELEQPGEIIALPAVPSPGEIVSWVASATHSEFESMLMTRPDLAEQLNSARAAAEAAYEREMERLGSKKASDEAKADDPSAATGDDDNTPSEVTGEHDFAAIVTGNVDSVMTFLAANPHLAAEIGDAEEARAAAAGGDPRIGVMRAVEVAIAHTAS